MRKIIAVLMVISLSLSMFAGGSRESATSDRIHIALIVKQQTNDFWVEMISSARAKAVELDVDLDVLVPLTPDSNEEQIQLIEQALLDSPDCFIIAPADSNGIVPGIELINDAGIPIVVCDSAITDPSVETLTFIGSDNYACGYELAKAAARLTGVENGRVAIIEGRPGQASSLERSAGAEQAYSELGWTVVDKIPANWSREDSYNASQNILQAYPGIDVIQYNSVSMALGAYDAVSESGQNTKMVAVDKTKESLQLMKDTNCEILIASVDNPPDVMGASAVEIAVKCVQGEEIAPSYLATGEIIAPSESNWSEMLAKYGIN